MAILLYNEGTVANSEKSLEYSQAPGYLHSKMENFETSSPCVDRVSQMIANNQLDFPASPLVAAAAVPNSDLLWPLITCHCLPLHRGRMIPEELEKLIIRHKSEEHLPFFVNCTTGTTVYGAYDPIEPIADICEKYGIWLHIDVSKSHNRLIFFLK